MHWAPGARPERLSSEALADLTLQTRGPTRAELVELLRVYGKAIRHDETDDWGPYDFFFA